MPERTALKAAPTYLARSMLMWSTAGTSPRNSLGTGLWPNGKIPNFSHRTHTESSATHSKKSASVRLFDGDAQRAAISPLVLFTILAAAQRGNDADEGANKQ